MLSFINPWILLGLAGIGIPFLIHFLTRPRPRVIVYPTLHLLIESGSGRQALDQLRTWIILTLRSLAVCALVLWFCRPYLASKQVEEDPGAAKRVVLLVDASMSMRAVDGGVNLFSKAKSQAADVLRGLEPGSQAGVVYICATSRKALPALSRNLPALHGNLSKAEATVERGVPEQALKEAAGMLPDGGMVYVFSDFQKRNWGAVDFEQYPGISFFLRPVVKAGVPNVGITEIVKSPSEPTVDESVELECTLFNSTPTKRIETVRLDLEGITKTVDVELSPYRSSVATFTFTGSRIGTTAGTVSIEADALPEDNRRFFAVSTRKALEILIISDDDVEDASSGAFFATLALSPSEYATSGINVTRRVSQDVDQTALETADVFVIVTPASLSGETVSTIARRVQGGADMLCFLDGKNADTTVNALAGASEGAISPPCQMTRQVRSSSPEALSEVKTFSGPLKLFDSAEQGSLGCLFFNRHWLTKDADDRKNDILARYADGSVALSLSQTSGGSMIFANMPLRPDASNIAGNPMFPVLLHEMLRSLRKGSDEGENHPGLPWQVSLAVSNAEIPVKAVGPDGVGADAVVVASGRVSRLAFPAVSIPGHYNIRQGDSPVGISVVNAHERETDTRPINIADILDEDSGVAVSIVDDEGELARAGKVAPLWPSLAVVVGVVLALEMLILAFWRKTVSKPRSVLAQGVLK